MATKKDTTPAGVAITHCSEVPREIANQINPLIGELDMADTMTNLRNQLELFQELAVGTGSDSISKLEEGLSRYAVTGIYFHIGSMLSAIAYERSIQEAQS